MSELPVLADADLDAARDAAQTLHNIFRGLNSLEAVLKVTLGARQYLNETNAAADRRKAEITEAVDTIYATAKSAAEADARKIVDEAKSIGAEIVAKANDTAAAKRREIAGLESEAAGLRGQIDTLKAQLRELHGKLGSVVA